MNFAPGGGALLRALAPVGAVAAIVVACGGSSAGFNASDAAGTSADAGRFGDDGSTTDGTLRSDGSGSGGGGPDGSGAGPCPTYQALCGGACIGTSQDPKNCGGCGHACTAGQACSAGVCADTCTTPTNGGTVQIIKCGQFCVDQFSDNHNCGGCGTDCTTAKQVCVGGACVAPGVSVNGGGKSCTGSGPPINLVNGSAKTCAGLLAQTTFRWGMCSCGHVSLVNSGQAWGPAHPGLNFPALYIDAYDSSKGPWDPNNPGLGGSLGVNSTFASNGGAFTFLTGSMWSASTVTSDGVTDVKQELHAVGPITTTDAFNVGQPNSSAPPPTVSVSPGTAPWDGYVMGNITATGAPMTFYRDLYVPSTATTRTNVVVKGTVKTTSNTVPPPCDSCGTSQVPVARIVDYYAVAAHNDDAAIGLNPGAMANLGGTARLDLPCGTYFLDQINSQGSVTIYAHGHTALFIGGSATTGGALSFTLDPNGSFDVFVKGTINATSDLIVGNPNYAALSRTYVGAPGLTLSGEAHFSGLFYAAGSDLNLQSHISAYGALYFNNFDGVGDNTDVHYDRAALQLSKECCGPSGDLPGCPSSPPTGGCSSCKDCGNQACINGACAPCISSAQCCAPLVCQAGTCVSRLQ